MATEIKVILQRRITERHETTISEKLLPFLPGVVVAKNLPHQLDPHQVAQQGVDGDHLEEQEGASHEHQNVVAGEVVQKVLRRWREESGDSVSFVKTILRSG